MNRLYLIVGIALAVASPALGVGVGLSFAHNAFKELDARVSSLEEKQPHQSARLFLWSLPTWTKMNLTLADGVPFTLGMKVYLMVLGSDNPIEIQTNQHSHFIDENGCLGQEHHSSRLPLDRLHSSFIAALDSRIAQYKRENDERQVVIDELQARIEEARKTVRLI